MHFPSLLLLCIFISTSIFDRVKMVKYQCRCSETLTYFLPRIFSRIIFFILFLYWLLVAILKGDVEYYIIYSIAIVIHRIWTQKFVEYRNRLIVGLQPGHLFGRQDMSNYHIYISRNQASSHKTKKNSNKTLHGLLLKILKTRYLSLECLIILIRREFIVLKKFIYNTWINRQCHAALI